VSRRRRLLRSALAGIGAVALLAGAGVAVVVGRPPVAAGSAAVASAAAAEVVVRPASGAWIVDGHGYGHGRGMSQWGARAAAAKGVGAGRILSFYYPRTTGRRVGSPVIRVKVGTDPSLVVLPAAGLRVSWRGRQVAMPASRGVLRWQVAASGAGLRLRYRTRTAWTWWGPALPARVDVRSSRSVLRVLRLDRTSTAYRGVLTVVRSGPAAIVVNQVRLDTYLRGVVPRESPASWPLPALQAQAVAARTYAYRALRSPRSRHFHICDTVSCQVYGGAARYGPGGRRLYGEEPSTDRAVSSTAGLVLMVGSRVATTEYSASHGGWIAYGGTSALPGRRDPYRAGDPYLHWRARARVVEVGRRLGFSRLDKLEVLRRDGQGEWGGRVLQARLTGLDRAGRPRARTVSGGLLRSALGVRSTYFRLRAG
jgi:hypothetical protein